MYVQHKLDQQECGNPLLAFLLMKEEAGVQVTGFKFAGNLDKRTPNGHAGKKGLWAGEYLSQQ